MNIWSYLVLLVIVGIVAFFRSRKLKSQGLIRNQGSDFGYSRYFYTLRSVSYSDIMNALEAIDFSSIKCPKLMFNFDDTENCILVSDSNRMLPWNAKLFLVGDNGMHCQYAFNFISYPEAIPQGMMIFHTALEKMFLEFDWDTVVESKLLKTKTKTRMSLLMPTTNGRIEVIE